MLKIIFIIFVFCVINKSFAQDTIDKICFNENNNPKNPEFEFVRDVFANTEPNGYGNLTVKIRTFLLDKPRYLLTTDLPTVTANEAIRSTLKSRIKDYISKNKLNTYQQICLIKCVVTNSLDHDKDLIGHLRPVQECYVSGEGDCVHYSYMFNDLASSAGIDSEVVSYKTPGTVTGHAFNSVVINNYKYFVDPLLDESCVMHINNNEDCPSHLLNAPHEHTPYSTVLGEWMTEQVSPLYQSINFKLNRTVDLVYRWFSSVECKSSGTYIYPEDDAIRDNNASVESSSIRGLYPYVSRRGSVDVIINSPDKPGCAPIGKYSCTYNIDSEGPTMKIQCVNIKTGICL